MRDRDAALIAAAIGIAAAVGLTILLVWLFGNAMMG